MRGSVVTLLMVALCAPSSPGCDGEGAACGDGTVKDGTTCRPVVTRCDPETTREVDGVCVPLVDESVPQGWTCPLANYGNGEHCDCECGAPDPDCELDLVVFGCHDVTVACLPDGTCEDRLPAGWACSADAYRDGLVCDCACGALDPDCALAQPHHTVGCVSGVCNPDGTCGECTPSCDGALCGDDGCGGSCGECFDPAKPYCNDGACGAECLPSCGDHTCGPDGCGGECGACDQDELCHGGFCVTIDPNVSCVGHCGGVAPGGCLCTSDCTPGIDCCEDRSWACQ